MRVFNCVNVTLQTDTSMDVSIRVQTITTWLVVVVIIAFASYYALSAAFHVAIKTMFVLHFQVLQFYALQIGPSFSVYPD